MSLTLYSQGALNLALLVKYRVGNTIVKIRVFLAALLIGVRQIEGTSRPRDIHFGLEISLRIILTLVAIILRFRTID